ncbi:MAG: ABC transporter permease [Candidatus Hinthialibacter antarcticus]|nr:ABC transporter permease [Candidatus Hinthialibacter antarcticus]
MSEMVSIILPGMMLMWVVFIAQNGMNDIFAEQQKTTLRRMYSSTLTITQILISKMIYCFMLCLIAEILMIIGAWLLFGMNWGNVFLLLIHLSVCNIAYVGVMTLVYSISKTIESAGALSVILILAMAAIGGGMMPYEAMPQLMKQLSVYSFIRWGVIGIDAVVEGQSMTALIQPMTILFTIGIVTLGLGAWRFKRRIESGEL